MGEQASYDNSNFSPNDKALLFEGLTGREFTAVDRLLDRPGYRLSFLDGILESGCSAVFL